MVTNIVIKTFGGQPFGRKSQKNVSRTFVAVLHFHFMTLFVTAFYDCISQTLRESKALLLVLLLLHSGAAFNHFPNAQQVTKAAVFHVSVG